MVIILYEVYADDRSFFFKNKKSVIEAFKIFDQFFFFSGLKASKEKCEVADIGVKKGVRWHSVEWKNLISKKHGENSRSSLLLQQKTWKEFQ